ncbi:tol-pal system protein YbgF [Limimaricola cinnabarinus]|jgi:tol-pal system protein YbgF|uniref:Cell division coordinator CpoB n=1 Tax=Limimaricola cinnabarinus TaxID=1125964 RepID=A0A2G1MC82_9RHOB|nr:tol-pal system protein YbgF [Limimaricola cinnabarinus]PHP26347.1 tol-pal system protein YbgF [Limimaricola cinnabarinus]
MRASLSRLALLCALAAPVAGAAQGQDQTLADIRQELSVLYGDIQSLKSELNTTDAAPQAVGGNSALERLNAIEAQLQGLTSKTEELEFRINRITTDGTNRVGDLEFRICELDENCDISQLGDTPSLGGVDSAANVPTPAAPVSSGTGPALAVGERADFERASEALAQGDFRRAADQFSAHVQTYPGGALSSEALFRKGEALTELGESAEAARAYLDSFSGDPDGKVAAQALYKLGRSLSALGQVPDACVTLGEVTTRFPGDPAASEAQAAMQELSCQ